MEKVTTKRYVRRNGVVVSETISEISKFDKHDRHGEFKVGTFVLCMAMSIAITALAVLFVMVLF
jgi:hypothetical protein